MNVEQLLDDKRLEYKDAGGDVIIQCLNPDHIDNSPSLRINKETGVMHCLACGFGKGIPGIFQYFNSEVPRTAGKLAKVKRMIRDIVTQNVSIDIPESAIAFKDEYRGISPETYTKYFAFQQQSDWEGRLVFPISSSEGTIRFFLGRSIMEHIKPKYMIRPMNVSPPIYPIRFETTTVVLVEGIFDMLNLEDKGMDNSVCCFGTHQFSYSNVADKLSALEVAGVTTIVLLLDNDKSGNEGAERVSKMIRDKTSLLPIIANHLLLNGKDPGDLNKEEVDLLSLNINKLLAESL